MGNMTRNKKTHYLKLESVYRIGSIPLVETGIGMGGKLYHTIKESNPVFRWSLSKAERSLARSLELAAPAVPLLAAPLAVIDRAICRSLDAVEARVPALHLPPQMMYERSAEYVNSRLVPALRRASSVQQLSVAALTTADRVVDRILPPDADDTTDAGATEQAPAEESARLRRKLRRRLTRQAFAEAKAIKEQIHVLVYVAELVATNPRAAWQKARSLYASLSGPEPENQARPATLEELLVLVTREAARRVVHLVNYTSDGLPRNVKAGVRRATHHFSQAAETLAKTIHLEGIKQSAYRELATLKSRFQEMLDEMKKNSKTLLEQLALFLAGEEREKLPRARRHTILITDHDNSVNGLN